MTLGKYFNILTIFELQNSFLNQGQVGLLKAVDW